MVSKDTTVHVAVVVLAVVSLVVLATVFESFYRSGNPEIARAITFVVLNGLVLAGAHLVLALRGEDGVVPLEARWRYLALLAIVFTSGAVAAYGQDTTVGPVELRDLGVGVALLAVLVYAVAEFASGYRTSKPE